MGPFPVPFKPSGPDGGGGNRRKLQLFLLHREAAVPPPGQPGPLSVRQDYWRQGLGRRLLEIQEGWCRSQGITKLCLEVDTSNTPALGLYLRMGFEVEGTLRREVHMADGSYRDLYIMAKFLDE